MNMEICNSKEDMYGNSRENIFLAFDDKGNYLGNSYAYPRVNYHQTYETPYIIFINVDIVDNLGKPLGDEVRQRLFDRMIVRARELRWQRPDLKARIYSGFEYDEDKMIFYIKNGFEADYSIYMDADIPKNFSYTLPEGIRVTEFKFNSDEEFMEFKSIYDEIFITPMNKNEYLELEKYKHFKNLSFSIDGRAEGGCIIFEKDGIGYIEAIYVLPEKRGTGLSKDIMKYIFGYFQSKGLNKTRLEVWQLNKRAVELYKYFGYKEAQKNLMFPGITL